MQPPPCSEILCSNPPKAAGPLLAPIHRSPRTVWIGSLGKWLKRLWIHFGLGHHQPPLLSSSSRRLPEEYNAHVDSVARPPPVDLQMKLARKVSSFIKVESLMWGEVNCNSNLSSHCPYNNLRQTKVHTAFYREYVYSPWYYM